MRDVELALTRGLPASGKSTYAKSWVAEDPAGRARVNRDDLRDMLHAGFVASEERRLTVARDALVRSLLRAGKSVIVDDTNLRQRYANELAKLAHEEGADLRVFDFTHVPVDVCVQQDWGRGEAQVGEKVIRDMHAKFLAGKALPLPKPVYTPAPEQSIEPYVPLDGTPDAIMVDLDGTLALMGDRRGPYEWDKVGLDDVNQPVLDALLDSVAHASEHAIDLRIIFMSARDEVCRQATLEWLEKKGLIYDAEYFDDADQRLDTRVELFMRPEGDNRKDSVVKLELFNNHIRHHYNVRHVFDDRDQVVAMWRKLGLPCFQVADGNF